MAHRDRLTTIFAGFLLAVVLTITPFAAVYFKPLTREMVLVLIAVAALLQIVVHLRFFLGIRLRGEGQERLLTLVFAATLLLIMFAGTLWIMASLNMRMMP